MPKYPVVSSPQNPVFKDLLLSLDGQGEHVLVHGYKAARDLVARGNLRPRTLIARESFSFETSQAVTALFQTRFPEAVTRLVFSDSLFNEVDPIGVPDIIVAFERPKLSVWNSEAPHEDNGGTLLIATQNPANLGACLRSAAAFGIGRVVCLKEAASPFHPRAVRGSVGTVFNLEILKGPSIRDFAGLNSKLHSRMVALDMSGPSLSDFNWPAAPIILIGEEGQGVPESYQGLRVRIPMVAGVESLNAAVSAGIALYDWSLKSGTLK